MNDYSRTSPIRRREEAFVTIDGIEYFVEDWLLVEGQRTKRPLVIVSVFEDDGARFVVIRGAKFAKEIVPLPDFCQKVQDGQWVRIEKPRYKVGQKLKNRFTERWLKIIETPFAPNDRDGQYVYFIFEYTPIHGSNFSSITETELDDLYSKEGVELC